MEVLKSGYFYQKSLAEYFLWMIQEDRSPDQIEYQFKSIFKTIFSNKDDFNRGKDYGYYSMIIGQS